MKVLKQTKSEITIQGEERELTFWIFGVGLIPLHPNPSLEEDLDARIYIKRYILKTKTN